MEYISSVSLGEISMACNRNCIELGFFLSLRFVSLDAFSVNGREHNEV